MSFNALIIDDDKGFKWLLEKRLTSFITNLEVKYFTDLTSAREYLRTNTQVSFDLVILDQHLPDGNGVDLLNEGWFSELAVLSVSSDSDPQIPGAAIQAGAAYFLSKNSVSEPLFKPLVQGIIDRNKLVRELNKAKVDAAIMDTIKTMVGTLRHEINNPLGAVLGAAYLLSNSSSATPEQKEAAGLVETSGKRIKYVLDELSKAMSLAPVTKANHKVFHIPGDKAWGAENDKKEDKE